MHKAISKGEWLRFEREKKEYERERQRKQATKWSCPFLSQAALENAAQMRTVPCDEKGCTAHSFLLIPCSAP
jgi:hypothetical protein